MGWNATCKFILKHTHLNCGPAFLLNFCSFCELRKQFYFSNTWCNISCTRRSVPSDIQTPRSELKSEASFLTNFLANKHRINKKTIWRTETLKHSRIRTETPKNDTFVFIFLRRKSERYNRQKFKELFP